jgi:hypothetical protein
MVANFVLESSDEIRGFILRQVVVGAAHDRLAEQVAELKYPIVRTLRRGAHHRVIRVSWETVVMAEKADLIEGLR